MLAPIFSASVTVHPPDRLAERVAGAKNKKDPMVSNTAVALLSAGCLFTMPALAFAQDDLMAKAREQFEPIPCGSTRAARQRRDPRKGRTREDALLRSATVREPYHQLQLMPQSRAWRYRRTIHLDRASLAAWVAMRPRCSMRYSTRPSSGMAGPRTSNSRPEGRWSIRWRWPHPRRMWPSS